MRYIKCLLVLCVLSTLSFSISFDDLEQLDKLDREDFAKEAKQKADNEEFKKAYNLLKKAKSIGINQTDYQSTKSYIQKKETAYQARLERERQARLEKERKEKERQARLERERQQRQASSSAYIVSWGTDYQTGNSFWRRHDVKLNNSKHFTVWLHKDTSGLKCYNLMFLGINAGASNCGDRVKGSWSTFCNNRHFTTYGNHVKVIEEIVDRCGGY